MDFEATAADIDEKLLIDLFGFHPLAVDGALQETHVPKIDDWGSYLYIVLSLVVFEESDGSHLEVRELDVFLGKNYLVTHHDQPLTVIDRVWSSCQRDERHVSPGADLLLYRLVDEVVAQYMPVVEAIDDEIDIIQAEIFAQPGPDVLSRVFSLKRGVLQLRRIVGPMREVLNKLARDDFKVIDTPSRRPGGGGGAPAGPGSIPPTAAPRRAVREASMRRTRLVPALVVLGLITYWADLVMWLPNYLR